MLVLCVIPQTAKAEISNVVIREEVDVETEIEERELPPAMSFSMEESVPDRVRQEFAPFRVSL